MEPAESSRANRLKRKLFITQQRQKKRSICTQVHSTSPTYEQMLETIEPHNFGSPNHYCSFCRARFWFAERLKSKPISLPTFSLCCRQGKIRLPLLQPLPSPLSTLLQYNGEKRSRLFRENIRIYNSIFSFTSIGADIDKEINKQKGPYIFRINGENFHQIGSLLPPTPGKRPTFAQLYVYDTANEVNNRIRAVCADENSTTIDQHVVQQLIKMFDENNVLIKEFRRVRDCFEQSNTTTFQLRLHDKRRGDSSQYNLPTSAEIAALIVGDFGEADRQRDIIVDNITNGLKRINDLHPSFMALQYPILFPYGDDGFRLRIQYHNIESNRKRKRSCVTMREFYAYRIQHRDEENDRLIRSGKLFQQYIVDAFSCLEEDRLAYIRHNQRELRSKIYSKIQDAFAKGDIDGKNIGKRIILPSTFTGSARYMIQNYHDAMAICRFYGHPNLFITLTCNVQWPEIQAALRLIPGPKTRG